MQKYKLIIVLPGKATNAKKKSFQEKLKKIVDINKGKILKVDDWGEIDLEYEIHGNKGGNFLEYKLELKPESIKAVNDKLRLEDAVVRYLLLKERNATPLRKAKEEKDVKKS